MKNKPRVVPKAPNMETVSCLEQLLEDATRGDLIGIAFGALYRERRFIVDVVGECERNPVFTRGLVAELDDELSQQTHRRT